VSPLTRMILSYTILRLGLFAVAFLILVFTPLPKIIDIAIALVVSGVLSLKVGRGHRDRMVELFEERRERNARVSR
jgi:hypothetical protein